MCNYETLESMTTREAHCWEEPVSWQHYRNHTLSVRILNTEALTKCHFYSSLQIGEGVYLFIFLLFFFKVSLSGRNSSRDLEGNQHQMDCRLMKRKPAPHQLVAKATMSWTAPSPLSFSSQPRRGGQRWWKYSVHIARSVHKCKKGNSNDVGDAPLFYQTVAPRIFGTH